MAGIVKGGRAGRPKGIQNKSTLLLDAGILQAWRNLGGVKYLEEVGRERPDVFCRLLQAVLPRTVNVQGEGKLVVISGIAGEPGAALHVSIQDREIKPVPVLPDRADNPVLEAEWVPSRKVGVGGAE